MSEERSTDEGVVADGGTPDRDSATTGADATADAGATTESDVPADADAAAADAGGGAGLGAPGEPPEWLTLDENEELQWVGQPATASLLSAFLWGLVLLPLFGVGLIVIAVALVTVFNTDYVVTTTTLYHKRGVLSTNIESVGLDRIQNTEYSQTFLGKQLGYGTIEISTAGSGGSDLSFQSVEQPRAVRDLVNRLGNTVGGTAGTTGDEGPTGTTGVEAELLEAVLTELRGANDAMASVERHLREEHGDAGASTAGPAGDRGVDTGGSRSVSSGSSSAERGDPTTSSGDDTGGEDVGSTAAEFVTGSSDTDDAGRTDGDNDSADDEDGDAPPTPFGGDEEG